jgi:hypothetical protein
MKKASSLIILVFFAALIGQVEAQVRGHYNQSNYAQGHNGYHQNLPNQVITENVNQMLRMGESRSVAELLRLSLNDSRSLSVQSITLTASARGQAQVEIYNKGRSQSGPQFIRGRMNQVTFPLPAGTNIEDLELRVQSEILLDSMSAQVQNSYPAPSPFPGRMQPMSGQMLRLDLREEIRYSGVIDLKRIIEQQLGITLVGAQIERIAVQGMVLRGMGASVQVAMNNHSVGPIKTLSPSQGVTPIPLNTFEEVQSSLVLVVQGDVVISQVNIRVGQVRILQPLPQRPERIQVSQQVSAGRPLELSRLLPYENRLVSSISLEGRTIQTSQAEVALISLGQILTSTIVTQIPMKSVLQLLRPMPVRDLRLESFSPVMIDTLEISFR